MVTLICDGGEWYADTYSDDDWVRGQGWDLIPYWDTIIYSALHPEPPT